MVASLLSLCGATATEESVKGKEMHPNSVLRPFLFALMLLLVAPAMGWAQADVSIEPAKPPHAKRIKGERPNQLDLWKIDLLQCGVNEVRVFYEFQRRPHSSFEIGVGGIFKNRFWFDRTGQPLPLSGERPMLANGAGVYLSFRQYMDKKTYFKEPVFRSYFSPMIFYRYSTYENEWFMYTTSDPGINDCLLQSEKIHQVAAVIRFGWQSSYGRLAVDFYSGMGFKFIPSTRTTHVFTPLTAVCAVNSTSIAMDEQNTFSGANVIFNAGVKLGIRRNNKERHYEGDAPANPSEPDADSPPQF